MKRFLVSLFIIAVIVLSWIISFGNTVAKRVSYNDAMEKGDHYYSKKLYDTAIKYYDKALDLNSTKE